MISEGIKNFNIKILKENWSTIRKNNNILNFELNSKIWKKDYVVKLWINFIYEKLVIIL